MEDLRRCLLRDIPATLRGLPIVLYKPEESEPAHPLVWLGTDGFHVKEEELPFVEMDMPDTYTKKFYEGIYTVRVLSDRPQSAVFGPRDLSEMMLECDSGDFVGEIVTEIVRVVTPTHMAELLLHAGSPPDFFQIFDAKSLAISLRDSAEFNDCPPGLIAVTTQALNDLLEGVGLEPLKFDSSKSEESEEG